MFYVCGLWEVWELELFSINVLELAAEIIGTFAFIAQARRMGRVVHHAVDFVDFGHLVVGNDATGHFFATASGDSGIGTRSR